MGGGPGWARPLSCPVPAARDMRPSGHHLKAREQREATQEPPGFPPKSFTPVCAAISKMYLRENSNASWCPQGESQSRGKEAGEAKVDGI